MDYSAAVQIQMKGRNMVHDKAKVRKDIQTYEHQGKVRSIARLGTAAGLAGLGVGGYTGNKKILAASALATLAGSVGSGLSGKRREQALGRIKRFYDLRDDKLINMRAVLPTQEDFKKHGMLGSVGEALHGLILAGQTIAHTPGLLPALGAGAVTAGAHAVPLAADLAVTPGLAKWMTNRGFDYAKVFAKQQLNKPLAAHELKMVGKAFKAKGAISAAKADTGLLTGPFRRYFTGFFSGPAGIGSEVGEQAGAVLKHVGEISPRYQELGLEAINSPSARQTLLNTAKADIATLNKGVEAAKDTRLAKLMTRVGKGSAPSLKHLLSDIVENPRKLEELVNKYKSIENKAVRGAKTIGVGAGAALAASGIAKMRSSHPLSKEDLPVQLSGMMPLSS